MLGREGRIPSFLEEKVTLELKPQVPKHFLFLASFLQFPGLLLQLRTAVTMCKAQYVDESDFFHLSGLCLRGSGGSLAMLSNR